MQTSSPLTTCKLAGQGVRTPSTESVQACRSLCKAGIDLCGAVERSTANGHGDAHTRVLSILHPQVLVWVIL